jgi:hypothetical protein
MCSDFKIAKITTLGAIPFSNEIAPPPSFHPPFPSSLSKLSPDENRKNRNFLPYYTNLWA